MTSMVNIDAVTGEGAAPLLLACMAGQLEAVLDLLKNGRARPDGEGWTQLTSVDVEGNTGDWHYWRDRACDCDPTPLHEAASRGHVEIVRALLAAGARRNPRASMVKCLFLSSLHQPHVFPHEARGVTPLHLAAQQGQAAVIRILVEAGANVNILGGILAEAPLHVATRYGQPAAMLALLHKGADINAGNRRNQTALYEAKSAPTLDLLLAAGADKNGQPTNCATPLCLSDTPLGVLVGTTDVRLTSESKVEAVKILVEVLLHHGAHASIPLAPCQKGLLVDSLQQFRAAVTPESSPCQGMCPVVSSTATTAASTTAGSDWSPKTSDASESFSEKSLSETDIGENHQDRDNNCPLTPEPTECFRSPRSKWVGPPSSPSSLLPHAAKNGVPGIVAALLRTGLDPIEQDEHRKAPLHYAAEEGNPEVLRLLLLAGADVDSATPKERRTPLHVACRRAQLDCVFELLRWGANLNALCILSEDDFGLESGDDDFYRTPLQVVGWADSSATSRTKSEREEAEKRHNAVRRALQREGCWRRRGGVVVLRCLMLKKNTPRDDAPTPGKATTRTPPSSRNHSSSDDPSIIPLASYYLHSDRAGVPCRNQDARRVCSTTPGSDAEDEESFGGEEEGGKRKWGVLDSATVEDDGSRSEARDKTTRALAGLMRLGRVKESLFRKVVRYL